jgi:Lon protease-like protein
VAQALGKLIQTLQQRNPPDEPLPLQQPWRLDDCGWVANRWCELLPLPLELKQRLMELDNPLVRLELVSDVLARTGIADLDQDAAR